MYVKLNRSASIEFMGKTLLFLTLSKGYDLHSGSFLTASTSKEAKKIKYNDERINSNQANASVTITTYNPAFGDYTRLPVKNALLLRLCLLN